MALNNSIRKPKKDCPQTLDPELALHIQLLGLVNVQDYIAWCGKHGFRPRTDKTRQQRQKERDFAIHQSASARLAQKKLERRKPAQIIERICNGELRAAD